MNCEHTLNLLDAYLDNELEPASHATVAAHLATCQSCAAQLQQRQQLCQTLRNPALQHRAPDSLRAQLSKQFVVSSRKPVFNLPARWLAVAASWAVVAVMTWNVALYQIEQQALDVRVNEVIASHIRSLQADHLVDIASSDQHNVKPWFNGRVDFSPVVPDLGGQGYALLGGRLDYLDGKPAAVVIYQRRQHVINVFIHTTSPVTATAAHTAEYQATTRQGYNLIHWQQNGMDYLAVSDLNTKELEAFSRLLSRTPS